MYILFIYSFHLSSFASEYNSSIKNTITSGNQAKLKFLVKTHVTQTFCDSNNFWIPLGDRIRPN